MAMFQCFKRVDGQYQGSKFPDPRGALAQEVPSHAISAANTEVALILQQAGGAKVSTRGTENGIPSRLRVLTAAARSINEFECAWCVWGSEFAKFNEIFKNSNS